MKATEAKRLKELEVENSRLKKLLAEAELEGLFLKHGNGREQRIDDDEVVKIHPNMVFESAPDGGVS